MSFPTFDPNQGPGGQFPETSNGNGAPQVQQQPQPMQQQIPMMQQQQGMPVQQGGSNPEGPGAPFQGQGSMEHGSVGSTPGGDSKTTLWMGELEPWIDENFVRSVWFGMGEQVNVKMIRDKFSGNAGYCFIDFATPEAATKALTLNGSIMPNTTRPFKLNWASGGGLADRRDDRGPEFSIFVGDLGPEVNEYVLVSLFQSRFPSCKSAKIMTDPISGMSRGYGFVRFSDEADQQRALSEMQGVYCGNRPMRISTATPKNKSGGGGPAGAMGGMQGGGMGGNVAPGMYSMGAPPIGYYGAPQPMNQFTDPNNTTVFVGGLSGYVTEDELRSFFQGFGEITYVKIPPGKGCGFVQFVQRHAAEMAINQMQGYPIGNSRVRLSWGRSQNNSGPAGTPYRPAPPPPNYQSMGMPPAHPYGNFAPLQVSQHSQWSGAVNVRDRIPTNGFADSGISARENLALGAGMRIEDLPSASPQAVAANGENGGFAGGYAVNKNGGHGNGCEMKGGFVVGSPGAYVGGMNGGYGDASSGGHTGGYGGQVGGEYAGAKAGGYAGAHADRQVGGYAGGNHGGYFSTSPGVNSGRASGTNSGMTFGINSGNASGYPCHSYDTAALCKAFEVTEAKIQAACAAAGLSGYGSGFRAGNRGVSGGCSSSVPGRGSGNVYIARTASGSGDNIALATGPVASLPDEIKLAFNLGGEDDSDSDEEEGGIPID